MIKQKIEYYTLTMIRNEEITKYYRKEEKEIKTLYLMHKELYRNAEFILDKEIAYISKNEKTKITNIEFNKK